MRFDPGKAWPHPVLRPPSYGDDYPQAEFEVEIEVKRVEGSTAVEVYADFELSDPSLIRLVEEDRARFVLLVKAPKTHCRRLLQSSERNIKQSFSAGELSGRVEFVPFLVCTRPLLGFRADGWHSDFTGRAFDIATGAVLAEDVSKDYWIDTADEAPLGSIFGHKNRSDLPDGRWEYELAEDRVWIVMSNANAAQYKAARERANNQPEGQYLMNGLYLPALVAVLNDVDQNVHDYSGYRWFTSLNQRLEDVECQPLGRKSSNRLIDAQKLLGAPFPRMPMIAEAKIDGS